MNNTKKALSDNDSEKNKNSGIVWLAIFLSLLSAFFVTLYAGYRWANQSSSELTGLAYLLVFTDVFPKMMFFCIPLIFGFSLLRNRKKRRFGIILLLSSYGLIIYYVLTKEFI
ncbi:hypothetical protein [Undibacterium aquatile]|uniref:Uncharacterized protein n=1 Tax=Undibacterium aquatile TaxID=1537398 RepID=A0ABR6XG99_9BURK|nr:hypothetical protein [Undibacterium aquatile]MBC3811783.1 hypothetical protein [Undibacterium aquatile]